MRIKVKSVVFLVCLYIFALAAAACVFQTFKRDGLILAMLYADIAATLVVWIAGLVVKNASVYDPYWSVAPPMMVLGWIYAANASFSMPILFLLIALLIWGVRLTVNFLLGWAGMHEQDWRYGMLKEKSPNLWLITNLFGINLFPTLIVFACMIPAYFIISSGGRVNGLTVIGFIMCIIAVLLQFIADEQMHTFKVNRRPGEHIDSGLWRFSRHPNYLGEITLWWGVWVMQMGVRPTLWVTVFAPLAMTAMFLFISIPMMETYISKKCPGYKHYQKRVSILLPLHSKEDK